MKIPLKVSKSNKRKWEAYLRAKYNRPNTELPALLHLLMAEQLRRHDVEVNTLPGATRGGSL